MVKSNALLSTYEYFDALEFWNKASFEDEGENALSNKWNDDASDGESQANATPTMEVDVEETSTRGPPTSKSLEYVALERTGLRSSYWSRVGTKKARASSDQVVRRIFGVLFTTAVCFATTKVANATSSTRLMFRAHCLASIQMAPAMTGHRSHFWQINKTTLIPLRK